MTTVDTRHPDLLGDILPDRPFPLESFPHEVAAWLEATASRARVPVAMVAMPFLAYTGAWIGARAELEVSPGWTERPVLWVALVAPTGYGKTPALQAARAPFATLHLENWRAWYNWGRQDWSLREEQRPRLDPLFTAASNREALIKVIRRSSGLCLVRDELVGLVSGVDRRGEDRQFLLSLWSSDAILAPDPEAESITATIVGVVGSLQPLLLPHLRGAEHDGLLGRFLLVAPEQHLDRWREPVRDAPDTAAIVDLLRPLRAIDEVLVTHSDGAALAWQGWYNRNLDEHDHAGPTLGAFYRKLPSHLARIALVLHLLRHPDQAATPLEEDTMRHAIGLAEYLRVHCQRAAAAVGARGHRPSRVAALAQRTLGILEVESDWVSRTGLQQRLGRPETALFDRGIAYLMDHNMIEVSKHPVPGSRKHVTWYRRAAAHAAPDAAASAANPSAAVAPVVEMTLEQAVLHAMSARNAGSR